MTETINHPTYYQSKKGIEAIDVIEAFNLNFCTGNAVKYIIRSGKKTNDNSKDLQKAVWYLNRELNNKENDKYKPPNILEILKDTLWIKFIIKLIKFIKRR